MKHKLLTGIFVMIFLLATSASAYNSYAYNHGGATHGIQKVYGMHPDGDGWYVRSNHPGAGYGFHLTRPLYHTTSLGISSWHSRAPGYGLNSQYLPGYGAPQHNLRGFRGHGFNGHGLLQGNTALGAFGHPNGYISTRSYLGGAGYAPGVGFYGHSAGGFAINHISQPILYPGIYRSFSIR